MSPEEMAAFLSREEWRDTVEIARAVHRAEGGRGSLLAVKRRVSNRLRLMERDGLVEVDRTEGARPFLWRLVR